MYRAYSPLTPLPAPPSAPGTPPTLTSPCCQSSPPSHKSPLQPHRSSTMSLTTSRPLDHRSSLAPDVWRLTVSRLPRRSSSTCSSWESSAPPLAPGHPPSIWCPRRLPGTGGHAVTTVPSTVPPCQIGTLFPTSMTSPPHYRVPLFSPSWISCGLIIKFQWPPLMSPRQPLPPPLDYLSS